MQFMNSLKMGYAEKVLQVTWAPTPENSKKPSSGTSTLPTNGTVFFSLTRLMFSYRCALLRTSKGTALWQVSRTPRIESNTTCPSY